MSASQSTPLTDTLLYMRRSEVYTIDEKMGQTYIHHECANTIAQRDYKQPQAVVVRKERDDEDKEGSE